MVRLSDVTDAQRATLEALDCPTMPTATLQPARALTDSHVALVSSAGLMRRGDENVSGTSTDYRIISSDMKDTDILMNHVSVNFDRCAFAEDINSILPRDRLAELATTDAIATAANSHYAFMGATAPEKLRENVNKLIGELKGNGINTVCLLPV